MKNLLVVDDSFTVRKVIEMLLLPLGYKLTFAENGKEALDLVKSKPFELVILDNGLPDIKGTSLAKEIKKLNPSMKLLLMKNAKEELDDALLKECQVDDVVAKPFDSQSLTSKIDTLSLTTTTFEPEIIETPVTSAEKVKLEESFNLDLGVGEEFLFKPEQQKQQVSEIKEEEEIEELSDLELIEEVVEVPQKEEKVVEEISLEELLEEGEIKIEEEKPTIETKVEKAANVEEVSNVNIEELFSDLNDILAEKEEQPKLPEREPLFPAKDVKPVVEEVAKDLKELETLLEEKEPEAEELKIEELEELDLWDFSPEEEKHEEPKPVQPVVQTAAEPFEADRASIERMIKEITYEVVEKIAWEVVPEIVDTILKDKFGKK